MLGTYFAHCSTLFRLNLKLGFEGLGDSKGGLRDNSLKQP